MAMLRKSPQKRPFNTLMTDNRAHFCKHLIVRKGADSACLYAFDNPLNTRGRWYCFVAITTVNLRDGRAASYVMLCDESGNTNPSGLILTLNAIYSHRTLLRKVGLNLSYHHQ